MPSPPPFTAVLFDLDGTLVATDRFWPDAARAGAIRAFEELSLARALPTHAEWMDLVGKPIESGFDQLFGDLEPDARAHVMERCLEAEHALLAEGRAGFLPGVEAALDRLHAAGVRMGIASNCGRDYLRAMHEGLGLERWIEEARCLDSPGITDKASMIEDLLSTYDTRRAVFVGDRAGDRDAAWANGLPHVHLARGYAAAGERVEAEATIEGIDALVPLLAERSARVAALARELDATGTVGVTGPPGAGKSLLAEELARALDLPRVQTGGSGRVPALTGPALVEGDRLWYGAPRDALDTVLYLEAPYEVLERRLFGRDGRRAGPQGYAGARSRLQEHAQAASEHPPGSAGVRRADGSNPLGPLSFDPAGQ